MAEQDFVEVLELSGPKGSGFSTLYLYKYFCGQVHCRKETSWLIKVGTQTVSLMVVLFVCVRVKDIMSATHILELCAMSTLLRLRRCARMRDARSAFLRCNHNCLWKGFNRKVKSLSFYIYINIPLSF